MISSASAVKKSAFPLVAAMAAILVSSCAPPPPPPPERVDESRPTVTYKYESDQELIAVRPRAESYCSQYQSVPRTRSVTTAPDGKRVVVFECVNALGPLPPALAPQADWTYTYRSDRDLLTAMQSAADYCRKNGARGIDTEIRTQPNGVKTARFTCSPT
jgi:hypothetical protein